MLRVLQRWNVAEMSIQMFMTGKLCRMSIKHLIWRMAAIQDTLPSCWKQKFSKVTIHWLFGSFSIGYLTIISSQQLEICNRIIKIRPNISGRRQSLFSLCTSAKRITPSLSAKHHSSWCLGKRLNFPKTDMAPARMTTKGSLEKNPNSCYQTTFTYPKDLSLAKLTTTVGLVYWFAILGF